MKESGKERLKQAIYESTLSTADAVPLPQWGRLSRAALRTEYKKGDARSALGERVSRLCFLSSTA